MRTAKMLRLSLAALVPAALTLAPAWAQQQRGPGKGMPMYDPQTEVTLKGTVKQVKEMECLHCPMGGTGTHLMLQTEAETVEVHLGPTAFLKEKGFSLAEGDQVEVIGSKVDFEGSQVLIARELTKNGKNLTLRNARGIPAWSRGRRY